NVADVLRAGHVLARAATSEDDLAPRTWLPELLRPSPESAPVIEERALGPRRQATDHLCALLGRQVEQPRHGRREAHSSSSGPLDARPIRSAMMLSCSRSSEPASTGSPSSPSVIIWCLFGAFQRR